MSLSRRAKAPSNTKPAAKAAKAPAPKAAAVTKATPQAAAPAAPAATSAAVSSKPRVYTPEEIRAAWAGARASQGGGAKTPFLKLTSGSNAIRLLPRSDSPVPFYAARLHTYRKQGRNYDLVDLQFLFGDQARAERAIEMGKVTKADFQKFNTYGDPFTHTASLVKAMNLPKGTTPNLWPTDKFYCNVLNRAAEGVYLWTPGKKTMDQIEAFADGELELLVDPAEGFDIKVKGNGEEGQARRYTYSLDRKASVAEYDPAELLDLEKIVLSRAVGFDAKVQALFGAYPELMELLGLTPSSFGLAGAAPSAAGDDEESED